MINEEQYLTNIIEPLVKNQFTVDRKTDDRGVLLTLNLEDEDIGRIIGKQGETIRAIRKLLRNYGMANDMHIAVKINEPDRVVDEPVDN